VPIFYRKHRQAKRGLLTRGVHTHIVHGLLGLARTVYIHRI